MYKNPDAHVGIDPIDKRVMYIAFYYQDLGFLHTKKHTRVFVDSFDDLDRIIFCCSVKYE